MAVQRKSSKASKLARSKANAKKRMPSSAQPPNEQAKPSASNLPKRPVTRAKRVLRLLKQREPLVVEHVKRAMFLRGLKTSAEVSSLLKDLYQLKKPDAVMYQRRNQLHPFDDETSLEFFSTKTDCSLVAFASHSKKRPNSLVLGRLFDHHLLDLFELAVTGYRGIDAKAPKNGVGNKPAIIFQGDQFQSNDTLAKLSNLLVDFFRGYATDKINLAGLDHVIVCTAEDEIVHFRHYSVQLKSSGSKTPRVELIDVGPSFDCTVRRTKHASEEVAKQALRVPKQLRPKTVKNVKVNKLKERIATVHMERQDLGLMATRKMKAFKKPREGATASEQDKAKKKPAASDRTGKKPKAKKPRPSIE